MSSLCMDCEKAQKEGYAYWCSICTTFIPSKIPYTFFQETTDPNADTEDRAGIILLNKKNELLLVRGPTGKLSLPKGKRKVCETDYEAACRECLEESGVDVKGMPVFYSTTLADVVYFIVSYTGPEDMSLCCVNGSEIEEIKWFSLEEDGELIEQMKKKKCNHSLDVLLRSKHVKKCIKWNYKIRNSAENVA